MKLKASITNGKLVCDKFLWEQYLLSFSGEVTIEIKKYKKDRTTDQNSLYWKYLEIISNETGDYIGDLHEFFKLKLLPPRTVKIMEKSYLIPATTTKLSTKDFGEYLEKICSLTSVPIPNLEI